MQIVAEVWRKTLQLNLPVFIISLVTAWIFFTLTGDFSNYYLDGNRWYRVKEAPTEWRVIDGFLLGICVATINTVALWLWEKRRRRRN